MTQLRLLVVASVLVPLLVFAVLAHVTWRDEQGKSRRAIIQTLDLTQEHALKTFETLKLVADQVDQFLDTFTDQDIRRSEADLHQRLLRIRSSLQQVQDIWVIDTRGVPLVSSSAFPASAALSRADRDYFKAQLVPGAPPFISSLLHGRTNDEYFFQFSTRRTDADGTFRGVTAVAVEPNYFRAFHGRISEPTGVSIALVREDGDVLVRYPSTTRELTEHPLVSEAFDKARKASPEQGYFRTSSMFDADERLFAYRKVPSQPVYLTASTTTDAIVRQWLSTMGGYLLIGLPATLGLFLLSLTALRHTAREHQAMAALKSEAERRELAEEALRQVQKMEAVGRLTGGIAHDFNNLLTVVLGNLDMLLHRLDPGDVRARRSATLAKEGAIRAALLTQRLLAFSRQQPLAPKRVDANALVAGMSDLTRRTLGERIVVKAVLTNKPALVDIDPNQLESAVLNLAVNARDAMPDGGTLTIQTVQEDVAEQAPGLEAPAPGEYVVIRVSDTGGGIPAEVLPKVFEPFFTTKPHGQGTGLGLSQVFGFIKQSGGYVRLDSREGKGTTVSLYLPAAKPGQEAGEVVRNSAPAAPSAAATSQMRTVLVVEDDPSVRRFSVDALQDLGFEVIEAPDAASAMSQIARNEHIDLLFTDVGLPGTDGRSLARSVKTERPLIRVLLTSGYANQIAQFRPEDGFELLPKPFSVEQLAERVTAAFAA